MFPRVNLYSNFYLKMTDVLVDTDEPEMQSETGVYLQGSDTKHVLFDTSAGEEPDAPAPAQPKPQTPPREPTPPPTRRPQQPKRHKRPPTPDRRPPNIFSDLDGNPDFARAMRSTLPKDPNPVYSDEDETDSVHSSEFSAQTGEKTPPRKRRDSDGSAAEAPFFDDSAPGTEQSSVMSESDLGSEASLESEAPSAAGKPQLTKEEEFVEKMKVIENIKRYQKLGILIPMGQELSTAMPLTLLRSIERFMAESADETVFIGAMGQGLVQVVNVLTKLNGKYDPFAKIFGMGLKMQGAPEAFTDNINLYEGFFKHIYSKLPKNRNVNPWIEFGMTTIKILAEVHVNNVKLEMMREVERMRRDPRTREDIERSRMAFEEKRPQQSEQRPQQQQQQQPRVVPPQPKMQPPSDEYVSETEDQQVEMVPPSPREDKSVTQAGVGIDEEEDEGRSVFDTSKDAEEEKEAEDDDDDDDVMIEVPRLEKKGK